MNSMILIDFSHSISKPSHQQKRLCPRDAAIRWKLCCLGPAVPQILTKISIWAPGGQSRIVKKAQSLASR